MSRSRQFALTVPENEVETLMQKIRGSGMSTSRYLRLAALGAEIKQKVPADVPMLINEVRKAETALDRLLKLAEKEEGTADKEKTEEVLERLLQAEQLIREAYTNKWL